MKKSTKNQGFIMISYIIIGIMLIFSLTTTLMIYGQFKVFIQKRADNLKAYTLAHNGSDQILYQMDKTMDILIKTYLKNAKVYKTNYIKSTMLGYNRKYTPPNFKKYVLEYLKIHPLKVCKENPFSIYSKKHSILTTVTLDGYENRMIIKSIGTYNKKQRCIELILTFPFVEYVGTDDYELPKIQVRGSHIKSFHEIML